MLAVPSLRRACRTAVAGALGSLVFAAPALAAPAKRVADLLPPDAMLVFGVDDMAAYRAALKDMPIHKILAEEEVQTFLEKPREEVAKAITTLQEQLRQQEGFESFDVSLADVAAGDYGRVFFAFTHLTMPDPEAGEEVPDIGLVIGIEPRQGAPDVLGLVKDLVARLAANQGMEGLAFAAVDGQDGLESLRLPDGSETPIPLLVARAGDLQLLSTSMKSMRAVLERAQGGEAASLAASEGFTTAQKHLAVDEPGAFRFFVDTGKLVRLSAELVKVGLAQNGMTEHIPTVDTVVDELGLLQFGITAGVSVPRDGVALGRTWAQCKGKPQGLLAAFPGDPIDLGKLASVPKDAASFAITKFDLAKFYDVVMDVLNAVDPEIGEQANMMLQQFGAQIGTPEDPFDLRGDLLANIGPGMMMIEPPATNPTAPSLLFSLDVREPEQVTKSLSQVIAFVGQMAGLPDVGVKPLPYEGTTIHQLEGATGGMGAMFSPSFAVVGDTLHVSLNVADLKRLVRRGTAANGEDITANEEFQRFYGQIPEGAKLSTLSYSDVRYKFETGYSQLVQFLPLLSMMVEFELPFQPELLPTQESIAQHLFPSLSHTQRLDDGFLTVSQGPIGGEIVGVALVAGVGAGAYFGLMQAQSAEMPSSGRMVPPPQPVEESPDELVRRDLNELKAGITIYKLQNGEVPRSLEQLLEPSEDYPEGYLAADALPTDPWGNGYRYERNGDAAYMVWSVGPNGRDEHGEGDDVSYVRR